MGIGWILFEILTEYSLLPPFRRVPLPFEVFVNESTFRPLYGLNKVCDPSPKTSILTTMAASNLPLIFLLIFVGDETLPMAARARLDTPLLYPDGHVGGPPGRLPIIKKAL